MVANTPPDTCYLSLHSRLGGRLGNGPRPEAEVPGLRADALRPVAEKVPQQADEENGEEAPEEATTRRASISDRLGSKPALGKNHA